MARSVRRALRTPPLLLSQDVQRLHCENLRQHRALLEALRAGNARAARELMTDHILATGRLIDVILDRTAGNGHTPEAARTAT
jgi:DNA-binding GntR family transcriptional regulator